MSSPSYFDSLFLFGEKLYPAVNSTAYLESPAGPIHANSFAILSGALGRAVYEAYRLEEETPASLLMTSIRKALFNDIDGPIKETAPSHSCFRVLFNRLRNKKLKPTMMDRNELPSFGKITTDYWGWLPASLPPSAYPSFNFTPLANFFHEFTRDETLKKSLESTDLPKGISTEEIMKVAHMTVLIGALAEAILQGDKAPSDKRLSAEDGQRLALSAIYASALTSIPTRPEGPRPQFIPQHISEPS